MKRISSALLLTAIFILLPFAAKAHDSEELADYRLEVLDFSELKVTDAINVVYHCSADSAGWAYFSCPPKLAASLIFDNNKQALRVQVATEAVGNPDLPTIHLYSSALTKVDNEADSVIRVCSNVPLQSFKARVMGNGTIIVDNIEASNLQGTIATGKGHIVFAHGKAGSAKFSNVGTGPIEAGGVEARTVKVTIFGTGNVDCCATEQLSVYGAGSGKVYYTGNPEKVINRSLGVKAFELGSSSK